MTLDKAIRLVLRRTGLSQTNATFRDNARDYLNLARNELTGDDVKWWWMRKTTTLTTTASTRLYALATDFQSPIAFRHTTDDTPMIIRDTQWIDRVDPDRDQTGDPRVVAFTQYLGSLTAWEVELHPIPDTSSETITYDYERFVADWTSTDDATELNTFFPLNVQTCIIHDAAAYYQEEKGDDDSALLSRTRHEISRRALLGVNANLSGGNIQRTGRRDRPFGMRDPFQPADSSLS